MTDSNKTKRSKKPKNSEQARGAGAPAGDEKTKRSKLFTIDSNSPEWTKMQAMPSVSRLLDRKKLFREPPPAPGGDPGKKPAAPSSKKDQGTAVILRGPVAENRSGKPDWVEKTATLPAASYFDDVASESAPESVPVPPPAPLKPAAPARVQPAQRRGSAIQVQPLYHWTPEQLKGTADPMGPGILEILKKGAVTVLFLARDPSPQPGGAVGFLAKAFSGDPAKANIWKGLKWNSNILPPDLWKFLLQEGSIEFSPPATQTMEQSARNMLRTSFGAQRNEWLILSRVGPEPQLRGLIAIVARQTLHGPIRPALEEMWKAYVPAASAPAAPKKG